MSASRSILLVEDNEDDVFLMRRALKFAQLQEALHVVKDGQEALAYLAGEGPTQTVICILGGCVLLDLKLPRKIRLRDSELDSRRGADVCAIVVVFTSSNQPADIAESYRLGANSYVVQTG